MIAIYHCSIKIISRGNGKSAVSAAAYRSGEKITNEWDGMIHDYTRKHGIVHRSYERQGSDQIHTVHIGVAASQMEKKGIATERGELNRSIKAANRLLRDINAQIGKLKEWLLDVFKAKESLQR